VHTSEAAPQPNTQHLLADFVPWVNAHVVVTKAKHPRKGTHGIVTNVLRGQGTSVEPRIQIRPLAYNPLTPFSLIVVDYDDVVEAR